jgi:hypothetical protein
VTLDTGALETGAVLDTGGLLEVVTLEVEGLLEEDWVFCVVGDW